MSSTKKTCVIIGASHGGVNCAFTLRKEGWQGKIILYDSDPHLPYHRPPLSKTYLTGSDSIDRQALKSAESYKKEEIILHLNVSVEKINRTDNSITLTDGTVQVYDKLVLATGARPIIPPIPGIDTAQNVYPLRTAQDVTNIRAALDSTKNKEVVIIGGGYIGLEIAASMRKLGASVTLLEREDRVLSRVTIPELSKFFEDLHTEHGVHIHVKKNIQSVETRGNRNYILCSDKTSYEADIVVVGVGIHVNTELARDANLKIEDGICVNEAARTNDENIYAIGDCTYHYNLYYDRFIRLESVQNAVDHAKIAAAAICGKNPIYNTIPWFWSDQYDIKLQIVGLSEGHTEALIRRETDGKKFSIWYFNNDELLAVDAINNPKAYVVGTKFIKERKIVDKTKLVNPGIVFKPANFL